MNRSWAVRRLARTIRGLPAQQALRYRPCTVTSVSSGAGTDGGDVTFIDLGDPGGPFAITHIVPTPAVGSSVGVLFVDGAPVVLGQLAGFPNY